MSHRGWSLPSSPDPFDIPAVPTNRRGMITEPIQSPSPSKEDEVKSGERKRRTLRYVSRHFAQPPADLKPGGERKRKKTKTEEDKKNEERLEKSGINPGIKGRSSKKQEASSGVRIPTRTQKAAVKEDPRPPDANAPDTTGDSTKTSTQLKAQDGKNENSTIEVPQPQLPSRSSLSGKRPRIILGVNIDEFSSDSDLTDVPQDIGPDPFLPSPLSGKRLKQRTQRKAKAEVVAIKEPKKKLKTRKVTLIKSPYFPHPHKHRPAFLSTLPFPPLHHAHFGLMQERLHRDPFRLLLATIFLNKTPGARAMPIFFRLMERYPTPQDLADAEQADVTAIIHELGFQNQRAKKCIAMAKMWVRDPPVKGRRWRKLGYPMKSDGKDVKEGEVLDDEDERVAWEISHLPGLGPYSHDSWRMFCRDQLRTLSSGYDGEDAETQFEPEWKRVLPADKELRAWMTWMWMKEGWMWNKETGERTKASDELMALAREQGNVVLESESNTLMVKSLDETHKLTGVKKDVEVGIPAGDFIPPPEAALGHHEDIKDR